ncbi:flagellar brake protein [Parachitinimonas caeni]|uniref:Flagellar brake protein n=1 Tax=Parachitinimonas caeni TaxID=3031301 RepID=A0ABT7DV36_9NEIS|nr:flagellar brake protein [Parachitinimonas caeni]MDK2123933.1 flagellar brake protein [Parachitinimonas caeni]
MDKTEHVKDWHSAAEGTQLLVRSAVEIAQILETVVAQKAPVSAYLQEQDLLFVSRLRDVNRAKQTLVLDYCENRAANLAVLEQDNLSFHSHCPGGQVEFTGGKASEIVVGRKLYLRLNFPSFVLVTQRRLHRRVPTPPDISLRCLADAGGILSFEARIIDISLSGFSALLYDEHIQLPEGTLLRGCEIVHPQGSLANIDLEVRHSMAVTLPDGSTARCSGCRLLGRPLAIEELMRLFITPAKPGS